jgi:hypothetical protein
MYFRKDDIVDGDYLSYGTVDQLHESILEKEEFLRKIPNRLLGSYQIKAFHKIRLRNVVWTRPVIRNIK